MPDSHPGLLLDTHVWIWVVEGREDEIGAGARDEIQGASRDGRILVSAISVWEVAMLEALDRIRLSRPVHDWVRAALRGPGVRLLPLTPEIAVESTRLPDNPPGDPADRILTAGARVTGARLVTRDRDLLAYAESGHLDTLDAGERR